MTDESIRSSEDPLSVFISSMQDDELSRARALAIETVGSYSGMKVWAFEDAPASSEAARDRYIRNAGSADFVIWLVGSTTSDPVVEEVDACLAAGGRLLPFLLPAQHRDSQTEELIRRVQKVVTWRRVEDIERLPEHIRTALSDEIARRVRDPVRWNHDLYLDQKYRESIADTKRLWTTFRVPDDVVESLAKDESIGNRIEPPSSGIVMVKASQGSGKTLAAHRLYQRLLTRRRRDHLQPIPVFIDARSVGGSLKDHIENAVGNQGNVHTQPLLVIIDSLDEIGRYEASHMLRSIESITDANYDVAAVVMTRSIPGLKEVGNPTALPECSDDEFLTIASRIAGRAINASEIPYRISKTRNPLFAVIVGTHLRIVGSSLGATPSQMVNLLVQRILEESDDFPEETAELLKKLGVATITAGEPAPKSTVDLRESAHQRMARSRLVIEQDGKIDFALAIFREWFAAKALAERTTSLDDIDLASDRWVVPLALAINSDTPNLSNEIMETLSSKDPGIAGLVLEEVGNSWSTEEPSGNLPPGTALEIGRSIREAMINWKDGLSPLMTAIWTVTPDGSIPTLAVDKGPRMATMMWYRGGKELEPVIEIPRDWEIISYEIGRDWHPRSSTVIENTKVWPWSITQKDLSRSLSEQLETMRFALDSTIGFHEFVAEFAGHLPRHISSTPNAPKINEIVDYIERWITSPGRGPKDRIAIGWRSYTLTEMELIRDKLLELSQVIGDSLTEPWPGEDKPWPEGRTSVLWFELYTQERLMERTNAIFEGALRVYNDIVDRWLPAFNKRHQMSYMLPLRLEGLLSLRGSPERHEWGDATLVWWPRLVNTHSESGVFFEFGSEEQLFGKDTKERLESAKQDFLARGVGFGYSFGNLPGNDPRPAAKLAQEWLSSDLKNLGWR